MPRWTREYVPERDEYTLFILVLMVCAAVFCIQSTDEDPRVETF